MNHETCYHCRERQPARHSVFCEECKPTPCYLVQEPLEDSSARSGFSGPFSRSAMPFLTRLLMLLAAASAIYCVFQAINEVSK